MSNPNFNPSQSQNAGIDFKCPDGSWWAVSLVLEDEDQTLTVKYVGYSGIFDERFRAGDFKTLTEVKEFAARFRKTSKQLKDYECWKMIKGMIVCAFHAFTEIETRFYDASVVSVDRSSHEKGQCTCTFHLTWNEGPLAGKDFSTGIENISLLEPGSEDIDLTLTLFLEICKLKFDVAKGTLPIKFEIDIDIGKSVGQFATREDRPPTCNLKAKQKSQGELDKTQETENIVDYGERSDEDVDLGGMSRPIKNLVETSHLRNVSHLPKNMKDTPKWYAMIIENLERDLTSSALVDFIDKNVLISCHAQVFPCSPVEIHTKGIVAVATREELRKLSRFLKDPALMVLSSRGSRPWVIPEKQSQFHVSRGIFGSLMIHSALIFESGPSDRTSGLCDELEVVSWGTQKYKKGKLLRGLYKELSEHLQGLYTRLALEEHKVLLLSDL